MLVHQRVDPTWPNMTQNQSLRSSSPLFKSQALMEKHFSKNEVIITQGAAVRSLMCFFYETAYEKGEGIWRFRKNRKGMWNVNMDADGSCVKIQDDTRSERQHFHGFSTLLKPIFLWFGGKVGGKGVKPHGPMDQNSDPGLCDILKWLGRFIHFQETQYPAW